MIRVNPYKEGTPDRDIVDGLRLCLDLRFEEAVKTLIGLLRLKPPARNALVDRLRTECVDTTLLQTSDLEEGKYDHG